MPKTHLDGQNAGNDWTGDADGAAVVEEVDEGGSLEEELCDDEVSPSVHLLLQVTQILLIRRAVGVALRVTCKIK